MQWANFVAPLAKTRTVSTRACACKCRWTELPLARGDFSGTAIRRPAVSTCADAVPVRDSTARSMNFLRAVGPTRRARSITPHRACSVILSVMDLPPVGLLVGACRVGLDCLPPARWARMLEISVGRMLGIIEPDRSHYELLNLNRLGFDAGFMVEASPAGTPGFERNRWSRIPRAERS